MRNFLERSWRGLRSNCYDLLLPHSRRGASAQDLIEYALMAGFVSVAVAAFIPYQVTAPIGIIFNKIQGYLNSIGNG